mgnify:CR=1 FL=1
MKITLLGATGYLGSKVLERLQNEHEVNCLVRTPSKLQETSAEIIQGDFKDPAMLEKALEGAEVVIYALNPDKDPSVKPNLSQYVRAFQTLVDLCQQKGVGRFIAISGASVPIPGEVKIPFQRRLIRPIMKTLIGRNVKVKDEEARILYESLLNWTLVRPGLIKKEKPGKFRVELKDLPSSSVDRAQLVEFISELIQSDEFTRKGPLVGTF